MFVTITNLTPCFIDQAEFSSGLNTHLGADIAAAVLPLGLAPRALPAFIGALAGNDQAALARIPGVTGEIIGAGVQGLQQAYLSTFRIVWITAAALSAVAVLRKLMALPMSFSRPS